MPNLKDFQRYYGDDKKGHYEYLCWYDAYRDINREKLRKYQREYMRKYRARKKDEKQKEIQNITRETKQVYYEQGAVFCY